VIAYRNNPFIDGNKRIGFVACVLFLETNGYHFGTNEESAASAEMDLAAGKLSDEEFAFWLRKNTKAEK
jgi:death on curing protein